LASRRESEKLMAMGVVEIDGSIHMDPGRKVSVDSAITITTGKGGALWKPTVLLHKPVGIVSTQPDPKLGQVPAWQLLTEDRMATTATADVGDEEEDAIASILVEPWKLSVAGRLDKASRGLLLMTRDGVLANRIIGGQSKREDVPKRYIVSFRSRATPQQIAKLNGPMHLDGIPLKPMTVSKLPGGAHRGIASSFEFILREGKKHQIRRCSAKVGLTVDDIYRTAIGPWRVDGLDEGTWRVLTRDEISLIGPKRVQSGS